MFGMSLLYFFQELFRRMEDLNNSFINLEFLKHDVLHPFTCINTQKKLKMIIEQFQIFKNN